MRLQSFSVASGVGGVFDMKAKPYLRICERSVESPISDPMTDSWSTVGYLGEAGETCCHLPRGL